MENIDNIELNSNKKCAEVCHVKSPFSFWVRLEEYKNNYHQLLGQLQRDYSNAYEDENLNLKSLTMGSIYCTFNQKLFEWQRCEVLQINRNEAYILYIDLGSTDLIPLKSIKLLRDPVKSINRFAIHCSLSQVKPIDGMTWSSNAISIFSKLVLNKIVTLTIKSKEEQLYHIELFLKSQNIAEQLIKDGVAIRDDNLEQLIIQERLNIIEPINIDQRSITRNLAMGETSSEYEINVSCIYSPYCFYVQINDMGLVEFNEFEKTLQSYYENIRLKSELFLLKRPQIGQMCVAKYSKDDAWYRAIVKEQDLNLRNVKVFFVDYGNEECVPIDGNLLLINDQFKNYPFQAIKCCLDGVRPLLDSSVLSGSELTNIQTITDFMFNAFAARVVGKFLRKIGDDCFIVRVKVENVDNKGTYTDLSRLLIENNLAIEYNCEFEASPVTDSKRINEIIKAKKQRHMGESGDQNIFEPGVKSYHNAQLILDTSKSYEIQVINIETVNFFYIKLYSSGEIESLRKLMADLQYFYEKKINLSQPLFKAQNACVYYDDDKRIYFRANIIKLIDQEHCLINLIDFGLTKYVNRASLKDIYEKFLVQPCPIGVACLSDLCELKDEEIDEQIHARFKEIAMNKRFLAKPVDLKKTIDDSTGESQTKYCLNLFDDNHDSVYSLLQDLNNTVVDVNDKFKPKFRSKLEETRFDQTLILNETIKPKSEEAPLITSSQLNQSKQISHASLINEQTPNPQQSNEDIPHKFEYSSNNNFDNSCISSSLTIQQENIKLSNEIAKAESMTLKQTNDFFYYTMFPETTINSTDSYCITISHFENSSNFFVQFVDLFEKFDLSFDSFQQSCHKKLHLQDQLTKNDLKQVPNQKLYSLAVAAKFYEDNIWYRARIINVDTNLVEASDEVEVQFIDYGNKQLTKLSDCLLLPNEYAQFIPSALQCYGLAYLNRQVDNLDRYLFYGSDIDTEQKVIWPRAWFVKTKEGKHFLEIDEIYQKLDINEPFNPLEYTNEPEIFKQAVENETINFSRPLSVRLNTFEFGLKNIYITLKSSLARLKQLNLQLESISTTSLQKVNLNNLRLNSYYLIKNKSLFHRALLITLTKNSAQFHLIDSGHRIIISNNTTNDIEVYCLMPHLFEYPYFAIHCRLKYAENIEKHWSRDEKHKIQRLVQNSENLINVRIIENTSVPFIIEFNDETIVSLLNQILSRTGGQIEPEQQTVMFGHSECFSMKDQFQIWSGFMQENFDLQTSKLCLVNEKLRNRLIQSCRLMNEKINPESSVELKFLKRGDLLLSRTDSKEFLNSIRIDEIRELIASNWSRVRIKSIQIDKQNLKKYINITYIDYGLEDQLTYAEAVSDEITFMNYKNYKFVQMPEEFKAIPVFNYQFNLNTNELLSKMNEASRRSEFIDMIYLNETVRNEKTYNNFFQMRFLVDFSHTLSIPNNTQVDLFECKSGKNLIDMIIENAIHTLFKDAQFDIILVHVNTIDDFYVQKDHSDTQDQLVNLQKTIQSKVETNKLTKMKSIEINKLCVSYFDDDGQYYRAKIIGYGDESLKAINDINQELPVDVLYIDYGNQSRVKFNQLREITPDLVDRLPSSFAIHCQMKVGSEQQTPVRSTLMTEFLINLLDSEKKLKLKPISVSEDNKYLVDLLDWETKMSFTDLFVNHFNKNNVSCVTFENQTAVNLTCDEDDRALADSINSTQATDQTTSVSLLENHSQLTKLKNNVIPSSAKDDYSWNETNPSMRNYEYYEPTMNQTQMNATKIDKTAYETNEESTLLYSTANNDESIRIDPSQKLIDDNEQIKGNDTSLITFNKTNVPEKFEDQDIVTFNNCIIAFMHSSEDLFLQTENFDDELIRIQPIIDNCLEPFDLSKCKYCIAQYKFDQQFYRSRVIEWNEEKGEALVQFIDFGNREWCVIDSITEMSSELFDTKPLAINCSLKFNVRQGSIAFKNLENIVNGETLVNLQIKKSDLEKYNADFGDYKCECKLFIAENNSEITEKMLNSESIREEAVDIHQINYNIKTESMSFLESNKIELASCSTEAGKNKHTKRKGNDDDDKDDDQTPKGSYNEADSNAHNASYNRFNPHYTSTNNNVAEGSNNDHGQQDTRNSKVDDEVTELKECIDDNSILDVLNDPKSKKIDKNEIAHQVEVYFYTPKQNNSTNEFNLNSSQKSISHPKNKTIFQFADQSAKCYDEKSRIEKNLLDDCKAVQISSRFEDENPECNGNNQTNTELTICEKNLTVSRFVDENSTWQSQNQTASEISFCEKNETVSGFYDSVWIGEKTRNNSDICDNTILNNPKNQTVSRFGDQSTVWDNNINKSIVNDETILNEMNNLTVSQFGDQNSILKGDNNQSKGPNNSTKVDEDNKNQTVNEFVDENSIWHGERSRNEINNTLFNCVKNETVSRFIDDSSDWNNSSRFNHLSNECDYIARTIDENNQSMWSSDPNQSIFDQRLVGRDKKKIELVEDDLKEENEFEPVNYKRIMIGYVIHVNTLDNFYFQAEDADIQLMNMKQHLEKSNKNFDKIPIRNTMCVCRYHVDKQLYRAQILETPQISASIPSISGDMKFKVLYIDYGNIDYVSIADMFKISSEIKYIPPLALNCRLHLSIKLRHLIKKLNSAKMSSQNLIRDFKNLTGRSKVILKQRNELNVNLTEQQQSQLNLVDLFIGKENICDMLLMNALSELSLENRFNNQKQNTKINTTLITDPYLEQTISSKEFNAYIVNLTPFNKARFEFKIQNESVVHAVDTLINNYHDTQEKNNTSILDESDIITIKTNNDCYLAPLPPIIINTYKLKSKLGRVKIVETNLKYTKLLKTAFIDFDLEQSVDKSCLRKTNRYLAQIQPAIETIELHLNDVKCVRQLIKFERLKVDHLFEIFKLLIDYSNTNGVSISTRLKATFFENDFKKSIQLSNVSDQINVNAIVEMCIKMMERPVFRGELTHLESDLMQFDCLNELSSSYLVELKKIYRLVQKNNEKKFKNGEICLVNCAKSQKSLIKSSESMYSLSETNLNMIHQEATSPEPVEVIDLYRALILDQTSERCVLLILDTGKKLTVDRMRLISLQDRNDPKRILVSILPYLLIKCKLLNTPTPAQEKKLNNSRYYGNTISMNIVGRWNIMGFEFESSPPQGRELVGNRLEPTVEKFLQTEKDLYKLVELESDEIEAKESNHEKQIELTYAKQRQSLQPFYYKLSHVKSLNHFFIHTSETPKHLRFIEEQIRRESMYIKKSNPSSTNQINSIYGYYNKEDKEFYRVKLIDECTIFFIDYGHTSKLENFSQLIQLSEHLRQMAPQAICCKLAGSSSARTFLSDLTNMIDFDGEIYCKNILSWFRALLDNKYFMASVNTDFLSEKKILNYVPLQSDNQEPVEIVIHLLNEDKSELNEILKNNSLFINELNGSNGITNELDDKSRNLSEILKRLVKSTNEASINLVKRRSSLPNQDSRARVSPKYKITNNLFKNSYELKDFEISNINSICEFFIRFHNWQILFNNINEQLSSNYTGPNATNLMLKESEIRAGTLCAFINRIECIYRRAVVVSTFVKTNQLHAKLYLIDSGHYLLTSHPEMLFNLNDEKFLNLEPLCSPCSLQLKNDILVERFQSTLMKKFSTLTSSKRPLRMRLVSETTMFDNSMLDIKRYNVILFANDVNVNEELNEFLRCQLTEWSLIDAKSDNSICFKETKLPLNEPIRVQLTNVDTARHFGIVLCSQNDKRMQFICKFHKWHKENRKSLKFLIDNMPDVNYVGQPCAFNSLQVAKWCRGVIIKYELNLSQVYLVDYCKTLTITNDRLFKLDLEEFLTEPTYVHRCKLEDNPTQHEKFSKYVDLIKSNTQNTTNANDLSFEDEAVNVSSSSHLSIDSFELMIECKNLEHKSINSETTNLENGLFTVKIVDIKRIKSPFTASPYVLQNQKSVVKKQEVSTTNISIEQVSVVETILVEKNFECNDKENREINGDETTENILCSTYKETALDRHVKLINQNDQTEENCLSYASSNPRTLTIITTTTNTQTMHHHRTKHETRNDTNEFDSDNTFSVITESTKIQTGNNTEDMFNDSEFNDSTRTPKDDLELTLINNIADNRLESNQKSYENGGCDLTSKWIKDDLDELNEQMISERFVSGGQPIRVRIKANDFKPNEFVCERYDLVNTYERLQQGMNAYYKKIKNASKSLEQEKDESNVEDSNENLVDSMKCNQSHDIDPFKQSFRVGDLCAANLASSTWFRCVLLDIEGKKANVECLDTCIKTNVHLCKLEKLLDNFKLMPRFAFKCKLHGIEDTNNLITIRSNKIDIFKKNLIEENTNVKATKNIFTIEVVESKEENFNITYEVNLFMNNYNVLSLLQDSVN